MGGIANREQRLRRALEESLVADPDDLAAHSAYADLLQEQGDPRGEFIQVQLALEDEARPAGGSSSGSLGSVWVRSDGATCA